MKPYPKLLRQLQSLETGLKAASRWPDIEQEAFMMAAHLHTYDTKKHTLTVNDWNTGERRYIQIDPRKTPHKRIQELHAAVRKHKASLIRLEKEIATKKEAIANFESAPPKLQHLPASKRKEPFYTFLNAQNVTLLVGKNAAGNELITFHLGHGNDLWLHVSHEKGAHVIVKLSRSKICDPETLQDAFQLALKYSGAKDKSSAEVVYGYQKQVKRPPKGKKGQVQLSHPRYAHVYKDEARLKKIKLQSFITNITRLA